MVLRKIGSILIFLFTFISLAQETSVEINPKKPIAGESFNLIFKIKIEQNKMPTVSFNPVNVEVISREDQGVSTRSTYINGKSFIEKEVVITYELISAKSGNARLSDIRVNVDGKEKKYQDINISILGSSAKNESSFVMAVPSKKSAYVSEAIDLDYYVYSKGQISTREIKKFPVLKDFVKRFVQKAEKLERVQLNGEIYFRILLYSAQIFPSKSGQIEIDPLTTKIQYMEATNDPFGSFTFGFRNLKSKTLTSEKVTLNILPIPNIANQSNFTGLVGTHDIKLKINKNKFLVNEPIEIDLEIKGNGLLENFEPPKLIQSEKVEEFETNVDLKISENSDGVKLIKYTYLPRESLQIESKQIDFTFFDPNSKQFYSKSIELPAILVAGSAQATRTDRNNNLNTQNVIKDTKEIVENIEIDRHLVAPVFAIDYNFTTDLYSIINILLILICTFFVLIQIIFIFRTKYYENKITIALKSLKVGKVDISSLYKVFNYDNKSDSLESIIMGLELSSSTKESLVNLIRKIESRDFSTNKINEVSGLKDNEISEIKKVLINEKNK